MQNHVPGVPARLRGDTHILEHRRVRQDVCNLVRTRDALLRNRIGRQAGDFLTVEHDAPAGWSQHASQAIKECAFARAVRTDYVANLAAGSLEIDLRQSVKAAELKRKGFGL